MRTRLSFDHRDFDARSLAAAKGTERVAVVIPARNEAPTIGRIVRTIRRELQEGCGLVDELVVVDDASTDRTAAIARAGGATVVAGSGSGKGAAMWTGLAATTASIVVFCDGDLRNFGAHFITGLCGPLYAEPSLVLVKGFYQRPLEGQPGEGGRVTELAAKPALRLLAPHLTHIAQPLGGELAARRGALEQVPFVEGYGVDVALLLDISARHGTAHIAQVDLGVRIHRNRPLSELTVQAETVLHTILARTGIPGLPPLAQRPALVSGAEQIPLVVTR